DLDNPQFHFEYSGATSATDHNGYVKGTKFYLSNNAAGLRVIDLTDIAGGSISEEGSFDSHIINNNAGYNGAWNVYPFFESGNIVISDRTEGFILVKASEILGIEEFNNSEFTLFPNPASETIKLSARNEPLSSVIITNILGNILFSETQINSEEIIVDISEFSNGIYFLRVDNQITKKFIKN
ncbi:MAG: choice-of-anchor B family protein, partial [Ignavibacteriaceae bacterium]